MMTVSSDKVTVSQIRRDVRLLFYCSVLKGDVDEISWVDERHQRGENEASTK